MAMRWAVAALVMMVAPTGANAEEAAEVWAGHQVMKGARSVPLLGSVETRTDSYFLATVQRTGDGTILLEQRTCRVEIAEAAGVQVSFLPGAAPKLPPATLLWRRKGGAWFTAFESGWGEEDADGDGNPGVTLQVKAPLCSGRIFVSSRSRTQLRGRERDGGLAGEARAVSDQRTLGADGVCLRTLAKDERDSVQGAFAYVPVERNATCESLLAAGAWPVRATAER